MSPCQGRMKATKGQAAAMPDLLVPPVEVTWRDFASARMHTRGATTACIPRQEQLMAVARPTLQLCGRLDTLKGAVPSQLTPCTSLGPCQQC